MLKSSLFRLVPILFSLPLNAAQALPAAETAAVPKSSRDLRPASYKFKVTIAKGAQQMSLNLATTIKEENGAWVITDITQTPQGSGRESVTVEKGSLIVKKDVTQQGRANMELEFTGAMVKGTLAIGGPERMFTADLGGAVFGHGPATLPSIACLPLAVGYSTSFRNLDVMRQKPVVKNLKVTGIEKVVVPAGTFEAYKIDLSTLGGGDNATIWIAKDGMRPVKMVRVDAAMGGAIMTAELQ